MSDSNGTSELVFDLSKVTAAEVARLQKALAEGDVEFVAGVLTKTVKQCPADWGAPTDPQTFLNLPFYVEWQQVIDGLVAAGKNAKASLRATSGNI